MPAESTDLPSVHGRTETLVWMIEQMESCDVVAFSMGSKKARLAWGSKKVVHAKELPGRVLFIKVPVFPYGGMASLTSLQVLGIGRER